MPLNPVRENLVQFIQRCLNVQFVVPAYQRHYVWQESKQIKKYLDDLEQILNGNCSSHFIGIMMYLSQERGVNFYEYQIVDGQQRLITTFLMLCSFRDLAIENGDIVKANEITTTMLKNTFAANPSDVSKIKSKVAEGDAFQAILEGNLNNVSEKDKDTQIYKAFIYIKERVTALFGHYSVNVMLHALNKFYTVIIPLDSSVDDAQKIFETINSAGSALTKTDLIRNFILMKVVSSKQESLYNNYWKPLEEKYKASNKLEDFFRMFLANRQFVLTDMENVYEAFQIWYNTYTKEHSVEDAMKLIVRYSNFYYDIFVSDSCSISHEIDRDLKEFKKNTIEPTAPILMEVYNLYKTSNEFNEHLISGNDFAKIIRLFNTYNIRRNIVNQRTGVLTRIVPIYLKNVLDQCGGEYSNFYKYLLAQLVDYAKDKQSFMPDDNYLRNNLQYSNVYALKTYLKVIFEKIENYDSGAPVDVSGCSIEHLMPQTPTQHWLDTLNISKAEYEYHLHRLGNLTLATKSDNSRMSNNPFDYKQEVLSDNPHLKLSKYLIQLNKWDIEEIDKRTNILIDKICELYPYECLGEEIPLSFVIDLMNENASVHARIYKDLTVEVMQGSKFSRTVNAEIKSLLENEYITENNGSFVFTQNYIFENLEEITNLVIPNNQINPCELWVDKDGNPIAITVMVNILNS